MVSAPRAPTDLQVCDFGLARLYGEPIKKMTPGVVTLWYRSPEILLGEESYDPAVDLWSVGCIFAELLRKEPLFPGRTEVDMLTRIFNTLGTPTEETWPNFNQLPNVKKHKFNAVPPGKLRELFPAAAMYADKSSLTETGFELLAAFLASNPERRISAAKALNHRHGPCCYVLQNGDEDSRAQALVTGLGTGRHADRNRNADGDGSTV